MGAKLHRLALEWKQSIPILFAGRPMCRIEVYKLGFQKVASIFFIGTTVDRERVAVDRNAFFGHFDTSTTAFWAKF